MKRVSTFAVRCKLYDEIKRNTETQRINERSELAVRNCMRFYKSYNAHWKKLRYKNYN